MSAASEITRKAKSNLAFALKILPRERRQDMVVFYAFCRTMDDLADDPSLPAAERAAQLDAWKSGLCDGFHEEDGFHREVVSLRDRHGIPNELLLAIIDGCRMDLEPQRFASWEELSGYTWKVACAVGLVSIRIFGCTAPSSGDYAVALGHALQLTNILRDVGEDMANARRLYLPLDDLERFGCREEDIAAGIQDARFRALMDYEAARAAGFFAEAEAALAPSDRRALLPARIMADVYRHLLRKMQADGFRVLEKRYQVSRPRKLAILAKHLIARSAGIE